MFQDELFELPIANFMDQLGETLDEEQFCQILGDMKRIILGEKEDFFKANYKSLHDGSWLFSPRS